jgi:hypothetical protein
VTRRFWITAAFCGIIPDFDYLGAPFGIRGYSDVFGGHRGITHGIPFAIVVGSILAWVVFRDASSTGSRVRLAMAFTLAMLTHGRRAFAILWNEFAWGGLPGILLLWLARLFRSRSVRD